MVSPATGPRTGGEGTRRVRRRRVGVQWLGLALGLGVVVFAAWWHGPLRPPDPVFRDRPLSEWVNQLQLTDRSTQEAAEEAVKSLGKGAVPLLAEMATQHDPWYQRMLESRRAGLPEGWRRVLLWKSGAYDRLAERRLAVQALLLLGTNVPPTLYGRVLRDPDGGVSGQAMIGLARLGAGALPVLEEALNDPQTRVRNLACGAVGYLGPAAAPVVPRLLELLGDADVTVRQQTVQALGAIGAPAVAGLAALAARRDEPRHLSAVDALSRMFPRVRESIAPLLELATYGETEVRCRILIALGRGYRWPTGCTEVFQRALESPEARVRTAALEGVEAAGPRARALRPWVERCLGDSVEEVRRAAEAAWANLSLPPSSGEAPGPSPGA